MVDQSHPEFKQLLQMSAEVGADPALVQAAGGNTSIKLDDTLWIKASGTWLMHATTRDIMVPVSLTPLLQALQANDPLAERAQSFVQSENNPGGLRPSIETTVHAALSQRVVVHVHCVETIALAVRLDARDALAPLLQNFNWCHVPYARPGLPLSQAIVESLSAANDVNGSGPVDVIVLGNHGLVVAAETVAAARALLADVCRSLRQPLRDCARADTRALQALAADSDYQLPQETETHNTACDEVSLAFAAGGSLYPDHVIFLGEGSVIANPGESANDVLDRQVGDGKPVPESILFPGAGVLMRSGCSDGAEAMARCLADVCGRIPSDTPLNYLTPAQNHELLNWDAEQYRQTLNQ